MPTLTDVMWVDATYYSPERQQAMPTTIRQVGDTLQAHGAAVFYNLDGESCILPLPIDGSTITVLMSVEENGEYVRFIAGNIANLRNSKHADVVRRRLLKLNYDLKLVQLCVDSGDGEIMVEVAIPVEDSAITEQQINRCVAAIGVFLIRHLSEIRTIIATGEPAKASPVQRLRAAAGALLRHPGMASSS
jgi:hypothetical protein